MILDKNYLKDKWFVLPIIILLISLSIRVYWTFTRLQDYPFENIPDAKNHIIFLFFLAKYGFHQLVPNYWNGFLLFSRYTPGWHFLSLPLYHLTGNAVSATFLSLIQSLGLGFIFIFILGRLMRISILKRIAFFLLFFASPVAIDYIKIGRYPELTGWVLFIPLFTLIMWYKDHKINKKFLIFIPLYSAIILTHIYVLSISSFLILCLFLVKKFKERIIIVLSFISSFILTSFWWYKAFPFMFTHGNAIKGSLELLHVGSIISYNTIILLSFLIIFYFYYKSCRNKKRELLFYTPLLILSLLILTRLIILIPVLNIGWVMPYNMFFLFIVIHLFFRTNFKILPTVLKKILPIFLIFLSISIFIFSYTHMYFSNPPPSSLRIELLSILPEIEGRYMFITTERMNKDILPHGIAEVYDGIVMNYAIINYNLSTPFGIGHPGWAIPQDLKETFKQLYGCDGAWGECLKETKLLDCDTIKDVTIKQNIKSLIAADEDCELLRTCGYQEKLIKEKVCLFIA